jgi:hypothetical protein
MREIKYSNKREKTAVQQKTGLRQKDCLPGSVGNQMQAKKDRTLLQKRYWVEEKGSLITRRRYRGQADKNKEACSYRKKY